MKHITGIVILLIMAVGCQPSARPIEEMQHQIVTMHKESLLQVIDVAPFIDSSDSSIVLYNKADSLLLALEQNTFSFNHELSRLYVAYTYIFKGLSYSSIVQTNCMQPTLVSGPLYSIHAPNGSLYHLWLQEMHAISSILEFYKTECKPQYPELYAQFKSDSVRMEHYYTIYDREAAYRITSIESKQLYYRTILEIVFDLYQLNHPNADEATFDEFMSRINAIAETLDNIPHNPLKIAEWSDEEYYTHLISGTRVQSEMLQLLHAQISPHTNSSL